MKAGDKLLYVRRNAGVLDSCWIQVEVELLEVPRGEVVRARVVEHRGSGSRAAAMLPAGTVFSPWVRRLTPVS